MFPLKTACLVLFIAATVGSACAQSCQLRVLTQTEQGQLVNVDGLSVKNVATGETNQAGSQIGTGVYAFDGFHPGNYIIAAAKTGFKRTVHTENVRCGQFSFTAATVTLYEGPSNEIVESGLPSVQTSTTSKSPFEFVPTTPAQNQRLSSQSSPAQLPDEDLGIDVGVVIAERANLRELPSPTSPVLRELKRGELVALVRRVPVGPWYNVIHVQSGVEGWINGNTIRVRYTEKRKPGPVFQERETGTDENPQIEITNDSEKTLYLKVGNDDRIVIAPHSTKTITKPAGTYQFYAVCPGVLPAFGERTFQIGFVYEWTFYIVTTYR